MNDHDAVIDDKEVEIVIHNDMDVFLDAKAKGRSIEVLIPNVEDYDDTEVTIVIEILVKDRNHVDVEDEADDDHDDVLDHDHDVLDDHDHVHDDELLDHDDRDVHDDNH